MTQEQQQWLYQISIIVAIVSGTGGIALGIIVTNYFVTRYWERKLDEQLNQYLKWKNKWIARYPDKADCISDKVPEVIGEHIIEPCTCTSAGEAENCNKNCGHGQEPEDYIDAGYSRWLYDRGLYDSVAARDMYIVTGGKTDNDQKYSAGTGHEDRRTPGDHQS